MKVNSLKLDDFMRQVRASATDMADMFKESETRVKKHCKFIRQDIEIVKESERVRERDCSA